MDNLVQEIAFDYLVIDTIQAKIVTIMLTQ